MKPYQSALFILLLCIASSVLAQEYPKREFRGIWMVTVNNIDWPSDKKLSVSDQKKEFIRMLNSIEKHNFNTVIVQIRPSADAFYASTIEPWSEWLTGEQGKRPEPYYDPLTFMIEECHKRNLEFHAWFNPFRAVSSIKWSNVSEDHISNKKPEWFFSYGNQKYFNPGIPEVRKYIVSVIMDVVKRYDIDGVHFDDYFYPYRIQGESIKDYTTFKEHHGGFSDREDWRRSNIDQFVQKVHEEINLVKPHVKFGISPLGIWRNIDKDPEGSATKVWQPSYDYLYADTRKWLEKGWIDYITPQLYWSTNFKYASYKILVPWWQKNAFDRHVYIGQAIYKIDDDKDITWSDYGEIPKQIQLNRKYSKILGNCFYSSKHFMRNPGGLRDSLKNNYYKYPALLPEMPWKDIIPPLPPENLNIEPTSNGALIRWEKPGKASDGDEVKSFLVYRFPDFERINFTNSQYLLTQTKDNEYLDVNAPLYEEQIYIVTSLDRLQNESTEFVYKIYRYEYIYANPKED